MRDGTVPEPRAGEDLRNYRLAMNKAPRYIEVPLANGDKLRVGAWPVSVPGLLITECAAWYGYEITHEESLTRICGPFHQRSEAAAAARRLGETGVMWDMSREEMLMEPMTMEIIRAAVRETVDQYHAKAEE